MAGSGTVTAGRAAKVLLVLSSEPVGPHLALDISATTGLSSGYVAVALARLERQGRLESEWEGTDPRLAGRPKRRCYSLTPKGRAEVGRMHHRQRSGKAPAVRAPRDARQRASAGQSPQAALAAALCDLAADALPPADRERYRAEWHADLVADPVHGLPIR
ncbi:MAG: PadR family transcriptional regulator [Lapillicoccus sp.]